MEDKEYLKQLGKKIREIRKPKMTQEELAERLGTKHTQIGRIERGELNSTINMLRKIAKILEISIEELIKVD